MEKDETVKIDIPINLYNEACENCENRNGSFCNGACFEKFISL